MRGVRILVLTLAILMTPVAARAEDAGPAPAPPATAEAAFAEVLRLEKADHFSEEMHLCDEAVKRFADDGRVQLGCGAVYRMLYRLDDAEACLGRAVELLPKSGVPLAQLAFLAASRGDDVPAHRYAERALALEPGSKLAKGVIDMVAEREKLASSAVAEPEAGTPAHAIWELMRDATSGRLAEGLGRALDGPAVVAMMRQAGQEVSGSDERIAREFARGFVANFGRTYSAFHGYAFAETPAPAGDTAEVTIRMYEQTRPDPGRASKLVRMLESNVAEQMVVPELLRWYRGLAPADRLDFVRRLVNVSEPELSRLKFQLRRRGQTWKIVDAALTTDAGARVALSQLMREFKTVVDIAGADDDDGHSAAYRTGQAFGKLLFWLVVTGAGLWAAVKFFRRR